MSARVQVEFASPTAVGREELSPELIFYLHDELHVSSVTIGEQSMRFDQTSIPYDSSYTTKAIRVVVPLDSFSDVRRGMIVSYSGMFQASNARSRSDYMRIEADGVLLRSYGYSLWFPVFLESGADSHRVSFVDVTIRVPEDFTVIFAGNRLFEEHTDGSRISRWSAEEIDLFEAQLTARRFVTTSRNGVYLYHQEGEASRRATDGIVAYVERLHKLYATYFNANKRFQQVHIMEMPPYGDISSGNVVGISSGIWHDFDGNKGAKRALAHEFVHPFVQVLTKRADPMFALAVEGFPAYFHLPILAELEGDSFYDEFLNWIEARYVEERRTGVDLRNRPLPPEKALYEIKPGEVGVYKDGFVLGGRALLFFDFLRRRSDKARFFQFTRDLFQREQLDHDTFERLIQEYFALSGEDLHLWLRTNEWPGRFRREGGAPRP